MFFTLLSWCEPNSPIRYPIRRQVRDRPTVGKKVYIQSDRLLCALCSSWHCFQFCFTLLFYTFCRCQSAIDSYVVARVWQRRYTRSERFDYSTLHFSSFRFTIETNFFHHRDTTVIQAVTCKLRKTYTCRLARSICCANSFNSILFAILLHWDRRFTLTL